MLHFNFEATISRYAFLSSVPLVITDEETLSHSQGNTRQSVKTVLATLLCII
ncbi:unknown [Prevotella sp. CAG:1124]|nr:unknown [Prevotella sp. CAG:1124]